VMMMESVTKISWDDYGQSIPAFLTMVTIPLSFSITDGIAFGFVSSVVLMTATGRARQLHALVYVFAGLFLLRYLVG